jgi:4-hydroxy-tetrahydrodipicolinate reductase
MSNNSDFVLGLIGCTGKLGTAIARECRINGVAIGLEASSQEWRLKSTPDVVVDASSPDALDKTLRFCRDNDTALIYAVSSIQPESYTELVALSRRVHVIVADNLAIGHWLQTRLIQTMASLTSAFPKRPMMSVFERHPVTKRDRPSASAKSLASTWEQETEASSCGEIASLRAGPRVSDHVVTFDIDGASLSISHHVGALTAAASGAILAAQHAKTCGPALSTMFDVYSRLYGYSVLDKAADEHAC